MGDRVGLDEGDTVGSTVEGAREGGAEGDDDGDSMPHASQYSSGTFTKPHTQALDIWPP